MSYTKLFRELVHSSIWFEDDYVRLLWITILALKDDRHEVMASIPGLAKAACITREQCEKGLEILKSPDPDSRSKDFEGRRIAEVPGGWLVLNGESFRKRRSLDERREYQRKWIAEKRKKQRLEGDVDNVSTNVDKVEKVDPTEQNITEHNNNIYTSAKADQSHQDVNDIFNHYLKTLNKKSTYQLTQKRKSMIKQSIEQFGKQACLNAIECFANDDWPERKNYTDVDHIFKASARYRWCVEAQENQKQLVMTDDDFFTDEYGNTQIKPESMDKYNAIKQKRA